MAADLKILITAQNLARTALRQVEQDLGRVNQQAGFASRGMQGLQGVVGGGLKLAVGAGAAVLGGLTAGMGALVGGGVKLNSSLENVEAQLLAFTKDGAVAKGILEQIRTEAASTPFAFEEMARATASLLPAAKQSGAELMDLVRTAEILAASNPAEGLEGAAFAIREALSGDFVSIVERFNLPRQRLNELKEQGVPAMEAISIAMKEMGLDADLVTNLAGTMSGRWSTFMDTMDTLKGTLAKPMFNLLSSGLVQVQGLLDANMPALTAFADMVGTKLANGVQKLIDTIVIALEDGWTWVDWLITAATWMTLNKDTAFGLVKNLESMINTISALLGPWVNWQDVLVAVAIVIASIVLPALWGMVVAATPVIAIFAGLVAGVALLRNAWERDWGGIQGKTEAVFAALQPVFARLQEYLTMIQGGDWSGLAKAVFGDVSSILSQASATIAAFDWADWIAGVLEWGTYIGQIAWDAFIAALTWTSDIVGSVDWAAFITQLTDWSVAIGTVAWDMFISALSWTGDLIGKVDWGGFIATLGDWGLFIGQLAWDGFLAFLKWEAFILKLEWSAFVTALTWTADIIGKVNWPDFIEAVGAWTNYIEVLSWRAFVSALTWGAEYIQSLDWAAFVATLSDWGTWIASLDWTKIITTAIDWALWIPALQWNFFVKVLDFTTYVYALVWSEFITKIDWGAWISGMLTWGDHVSDFDWGEWVSGALDWSAYIVAFTWDSFVSKLDWPVIAEFAWSEWIADFTWPTLPSFSWGSWIGSFAWPALPSFSWSSFIPSFTWPSLPSIPNDWWRVLIGGGGQRNAAGTPFFTGGMTLVGERGPEMVYLPRGSRIENAEATAAMSGGDVYVTVNANVASAVDVETLAWQIAQKVAERRRR